MVSPASVCSLLVQGSSATRLVCRVAEAMVTLGLAALKSDECHRTFIRIAEDVCDSEAASSTRQEVSGSPAQHAALQSEHFHHSRKTVVAQNSIFVATSVSINTSPLCFHAGIHYRKSCASSGACLIASSGYQQFCTGRLNSVCIYCCNTPLCNGPRRRRPISSAAATSNSQLTIQMLLLLASHVMPRLLM